MLKQHPKILSYTAQALDVFTLIGAFFLSFPLRHFLIQWAPYGSKVDVRDFVGLLFLTIFVWWLLLKWQETYGPQRLMSLKALVGKILRTALLGTLSLVGFVYLAKWTAVPRTLILTLGFLGFWGLCFVKENSSTVSAFCGAPVLGAFGNLTKVLWASGRRGNPRSSYKGFGRY